MAQPVYHNEAKRLRELANDSEVVFSYTRHALEEMRKDQVWKLDVESVLRRCSVVRVELNLGEEAWNARGQDTDERMLEIVVVAYETDLRIKIISAWERKGG